MGSSPSAYRWGSIYTTVSAHLISLFMNRTDVYLQTPNTMSQQEPSTTPSQTANSTPLLTVDPKQFVQQLHLFSPRVKAHPRKLHKGKRRSPNPSVTDEQTLCLTRSANEAKIMVKQPKLTHLGDWIRYTASVLKLKKNIYNRAVQLLTLATSQQAASYPLAAASLSLIIKFECSDFFRKGGSLPPRHLESMRPTFHLRNLMEAECTVLKAIGFRIPPCDVFLLAMLNVCEKWTRYVRSNSRHVTLPLRYLQAGMEQEWQKRNIYGISYLVDLINVTPSIREQLSPQGRSLVSLQGRFFSEDEVVLVGASILLVCATNSCTVDKLNSGDYVLCRVLKAFLKKCFKLEEKHMHRLERLLLRCCEHRLWEKLSLITPISHMKAAPKSEEEKLEWLDHLEYLPMSDCSTSADL